MRRTLLAVAFLLAGCSANQNGTTAQTAQAAPNWTMPTSTGGTLTLASFRGKAVYLNFFATWCGPCKEEAPYINAIQKQYAKQGLQIIGVDELESAKQAESFRKQYGLMYPAIVDGGKLQGQYLINGLPEHVFIGRDGVIKKMVAGEMSRAQILAAVHSIL